MKYLHIRPLSASIIGLFLVAFVLSPLTVSAEAVGTDLINNFFTTVTDTLKNIAPFAAGAFIIYSAVRVFLDSDNPQKRSGLISSVVISAVVLIIVFGAETIVTQLTNIAGG